MISVVLIIITFQLNCFFYSCQVTIIIEHNSTSHCVYTPLVSKRKRHTHRVCMRETGMYESECMHACMRVCVCVCTRVRVHVRVVCVCMHVCLHTYVYTHACMHACVRACAFKECISTPYTCAI